MRLTGQPVCVASYGRPREHRWLSPLEARFEGTADASAPVTGSYVVIQPVKLVRSLIAAVFVQGKKLVLMVGSRQFDLLDETVFVRRRAIIPFTRTVTIEEHGKEALRLTYWTSRDESPEVGDLFSYAERTCRTPQLRRRAHKIRTEIAAGANTEDKAFWRRLQAEENDEQGGEKP